MNLDLYIVSFFISIWISKNFGILVQNLEQKEYLSHIRKSIGLCDQSNILFDHMTVIEHLEFFAHLKCIPYEKFYEEINNTIQKVGIIIYQFILYGL